MTPEGCVISSFITKPQHKRASRELAKVALYPLSSPNHNYNRFRCCACLVALYPLSSPNHNFFGLACVLLSLRYILFHHQTTTDRLELYKKYTLRYILFHHQTTTPCWLRISWVRLRYILFHHQTTTVTRYVIRDNRCVISSFITKPQLTLRGILSKSVALYPLSSPNHNMIGWATTIGYVALYPLSSPNHNFIVFGAVIPVCCVISSFITKPQLCQSFGCF